MMVFRLIHRNVKFVVSCSGVTLLALILIAVSTAHAAKPLADRSPPAIIDESLTSQNLTGHIEYIEDPDGLLTIEDINNQAIHHQFVPAGTPPLNFGLSKSAYWLRFTLYNPTENPIPVFLEIAYPMLNDVQFFLPDGDTFIVYQTGSAFDFDSRAVIHSDYIFQIKQPPGKLTGYLRIQSLSSAVNLPITVYSEAYFHRHKALMAGINGVFYGILLIMLLYNLFLTFTVREKAYIFYVSYIAAITVMLLTFDGYGHQFLWSRFNWLNIPSFSIFPTNIALLLFTRHFLNMPIALPLTNKIFSWHLALCLFLFCINFAFPFSLAKGSIISTLITAILSIISGFALLHKGERAAKFYLASWLILLIGAFIRGMMGLNLTPTLAAAPMLLKFSVVFQILIFSFALGDKINMMRKSLAREVSEHEKAEKALREKEEYFRSLIEHSSDVIAILNAEGNIIYESPAHQTVLGYSPGYLIDKNAFEFVHPDDQTKIIEIFEKYLSSPNVIVPVEFRFRHADGSWRNIEGIGKNLLNHPSVNGIVVNYRDISDRKKAVLENVRLQKLLSNIINSMPSVIIGIDPELKIRHWNKTAEITTGLREQDVLNQPLKDVCPSIESRKEEIRMAIGQSQITYFQRIKSFFPKKNNSISDITVYPLESNGIDGAVIRVDDVTRSVAAENERKMLEDQLRQAQKMDALGTLAGGIAHDFNNLLGAMLGSSELIYHCIEDPAKVRSHIDRIEKAGLRARDLVRQILAFSRRTETEKKPVDIHTLIEETLSFMRASLPATVEIRQEICTDALYVIGDATQLHQVIINLCTNALHAMAEGGGKIEIVLDSVSIEDQPIAIQHNAASGPYCKLSVSDTGCGMDPAALDRIFEPFYTTKAPGEGIGLGLSVIHGIIKAHNGFINVTSMPGKGSCFEIFLPCRTDSPPQQVSFEKPPSAIGNNERIMFIDDEEHLVEIGQEMLKSLGYRVDGFLDAVNALSFFEQDPHRFDLIITDMTMPGMTGDHLIRKILLIRPEIPVIIASGFNAQITPDQTAEMGISALLNKPYSIYELSIAIKTALSDIDTRML